MWKKTEVLCFLITKAHRGAFAPFLSVSLCLGALFASLKSISFFKEIYEEYCAKLRTLNFLILEMFSSKVHDCNIAMTQMVGDVPLFCQSIQNLK